jgi:hypothetical protein
MEAIDKLIGIAIIILFVLIINHTGDYFACKSKYTEFNPKYGIISGCMIEYKGKRMPAETLRIVD